MLLPAAVDLYYNHEDWQVFVWSAVITGGAALAVALATHGNVPPASTRFGFLLVNLLWLTMAVAGALPLFISSLQLSFADAFLSQSPL